MRSVTQHLVSVQLCKMHFHVLIGVFAAALVSTTLSVLSSQGNFEVAERGGGLSPVNGERKKDN